MNKEQIDTDIKLIDYILRASSFSNEVTVNSESIIAKYVLRNLDHAFVLKIYDKVNKHDFYITVENNEIVFKFKRIKK
ncbi:MAG: hypothetical protein ACOC1K_00515 [Nanoarchaeota archaeon]